MYYSNSCVNSPTTTTAIWQFRLITHSGINRTIRLKFHCGLCANRIAQNFGGRKPWRIWWLMTNLPKFYPLKTFYPSYFAVPDSQPVNIFVHQNAYWHRSAKVFYHQSFVLFGISCKVHAPSRLFTHNTDDPTDYCMYVT